MLVDSGQFLPQRGEAVLRCRGRQWFLKDGLGASLGLTLALSERLRERVGGTCAPSCMEPWEAGALSAFPGPVQEEGRRCGHAGGEGGGQGYRGPETASLSLHLPQCNQKSCKIFKSP